MFKPFIKKKRTVFILILTVLFLSACSANPQETAEEFSSSVENNDSKALINLVTFDEDTYWTEQQASDVISYFQDNQETYQEQLDLLNQQVDALENDTQLSTEEGLFYFNEDSELEVRKYEVTAINDSAEAQPNSISVTVEENDAIELENVDEDVLGIFGPGNYEFQAEAEYPYAMVENNDSFSLLSLNSFTESIDLSLSGSMIRLSSSLPNTKIKVNGEELGSIADSTMGDSRFGPVSEDTTIQGVSSLPWGETESEEITIGEIDEYEKKFDVTPPLLENEKEREQITELMNNYLETEMEAYIHLDINELLEDISVELKESLNETLKHAVNYGWSYEGKALGTRINYSAATYEESEDGKHYLSLPVEFHYELLTNYYLDTDDEPEEEYRVQLVTLEYLEDDEKWFIYNRDSNGDNDMTGEDVVETEIAKANSEVTETKTEETEVSRAEAEETETENIAENQDKTQQEISDQITAGLEMRQYEVGENILKSYGATALSKNNLESSNPEGAWVYKVKIEDNNLIVWGSLNSYSQSGTEEEHLEDQKRTFKLADDVDLGLDWVGNREEQIQYFNENGDNLNAQSFSFQTMDDEVTHITFAG